MPRRPSRTLCRIDLVLVLLLFVAMPALAESPAPLCAPALAERPAADALPSVEEFLLSAFPAASIDGTANCPEVYTHCGLYDCPACCSELGMAGGRCAIGGDCLCWL